MDPSFNTTMVRLTDAADGVNCRISYGIWSPFSCDYKKILIECDGLFKIVTWNPTTMSEWGDITLPASFQGSDAIWSHTSPDWIFHRDGGSRLMMLNVVTGEDLVVHDFASDFPGSPYLARMSASADDNLFCFARQTTAYAFSGFCVYDAASGAIYAEPPSRSGQYFKVQIDKSGRWMWNVATDPNGEWWDLTLPSTQIPKLIAGTGHSAVLTGAAAQYDNSTDQDVLRWFGVGGMISTISWPDWDLATEYSGTDADELWYAVTTNTIVPVGPLHDELLQVATDGSGTVRRLCHLHNVINVINGQWDYNSESQPAAGYGGQSWIAMHSSWGNRARRDVFLVKAMPPIITGFINANYLSIYGTGFIGAIQPTITIGGVVATVIYAGRDGAGDGQDQINVIVPPELIGMGRLPVVVTCDGLVSDSMDAVV